MISTNCLTRNVYLIQEMQPSDGLELSDGDGVILPL